MDEIAREAFDEATRQALFEYLAIAPHQLTDLGGFESFVFSRADRESILRITHISHRSLAQVTAELDWIDYLARQGAAVCTPLRQPGGEFALAWREFIVCEFACAKGAMVTEADWNPALFATWGASIGLFHSLTRQYAPPSDEIRRPDCSVDANFDLVSLVPDDQAVVREKASHYRSRFMAQPRTATTFGLIHSDPHAGNFFRDDGRLTFFDFDDACYCWFAYDVGTILLSAVMQPWIGESQPAREEACRRFLPAFLEGYASSYDVTPALIAQLPLSLKFREICLYGVIETYLPMSQRNWYATRFMTARRPRIEQDVPYLDLDFLR